MALTWVGESDPGGLIQDRQTGICTSSVTTTRRLTGEGATVGEDYTDDPRQQHRHDHLVHGREGSNMVIIMNI